MDNNRLIMLRVLAVSMFCTLLGRLFVMQVVNATEYQQQASNNQVREVVVPSPRGLILDQVGRVLTGNRSSLVVSIDRTAMLNQTDEGVATLRKLGSILRMTVPALQQRLTLCGTEGAAPPPICWNGSPFQPIPVARGVSTAVALQVMERRSELKGVQAELQSEREFPQPFNANLAQVLGYLGPVSDQELADALSAGRTLKRTDLVGRSGLEKVYDTQLRGTPGVTQYAIDRNSTIIGTVDKTEPIAGAYLVTSIDARLQAVVEKQLAAAIARAREQGFPGDSGAAVVLDIKTGRVLAIASYPSYDPSIWIGGISTKDYKELTAPDSGNPLFFRPTQALFPPASTFKAITTIAAGNAGYPLSQNVACPSSIDIGTRTLRNHESNAYGTISIARAMEVSCNTVFYKIGYDLWLQDGGNNPKRAQDVIEKTAKAFGLGSRTGLDLPSESNGRVAGRAFKAEQYLNFREIWCRRAQIGYPEVSKTDPVRGAYLTELAKENCVDGGKLRGGDAANNAIGQGDTAVTPLQMAVAYAAIANGGKIWQPMIAKALISADGKTIKTFTPKVRSTVKIKKSVRDYVLKALRGVPTNGTGMYPFRGFPLDKIPVAAKTGSGEVTNADAPVSWFNAFAPAGNPRYEVVMMVSQGGTGALTSGPSVRKIMEALFGVDGDTVNPKQSVLLNNAPSTKLPTVRADGTVVPLKGIVKTWSPLASKRAKAVN